MPEVNSMEWGSMDLETLESRLKEEINSEINAEYPYLGSVKFTLSLSPYANYDFYRLPKHVAVLKKLRPHIFDINFTAQVDPFCDDALLVDLNRDQAEGHLQDMLYLQKETGITVSPVFNNIYTSNNLQTLEKFVKGFKRFYDLGIRSCTLPHTLWLKFGLLQKEFPELYLKNTVLRECKSGQDFWNFARAGFQYVNIDRRLMRDLKALAEIKQSQLKYQERYGRYVMLSILTNEGCRGDCPFWAEHYQHSLFYKKSAKQLPSDYASIVPRYSCQQSRYTESDNNWRSVTLPLLKEDLNQVLPFIDVIKLPGRAFDENIFYQQLNNILAIKFNNQPVIDNNDSSVFSRILKAYALNNLQDCDLVKKIEQWRQKTRNCRFQCWDCQLCEELKAMVYQVHRV